jgi:hypothetical protein
VITRPSPQQVLDGVRGELRDRIAPEVHSPTAKVALEMIDNVLTNVGTRAMHEIAWMREEAARTVAVATDALDRLPEGSLRDALGRALDDEAAQRTDSLHYADVQADYSRASEILSCGLEAAVATHDPELTASFTGLLRERLGHEVDIMGDWGFVGRG